MAFLLPLQLTVWGFFLRIFRIWLEGLVLPCTVWKLSIDGVASNAHASGNASKLTARITPMSKIPLRHLNA
jgi:hypothetical protein